MSEEALSTLDVTRNNITFQLKPIEKKRNLDNVDPALATYLGLRSEDVSLDNLAAYYGEEMTKDILLGFFNKRAQNLFKSATNDGKTPVNRELLKSSVESLSVVGESIKDLEERRGELFDELMTPAVLSGPVEKREKLAEQIKAINEAIEAKRRAPRATKEENEPVAAAA